MLISHKLTGGMMVTLSDRAIEKFREFLGPGNTHGIRIFVTTGG